MSAPDQRRLREFFGADHVASARIDPSSGLTGARVSSGLMTTGFRTNTENDYAATGAASNGRSSARRLRGSRDVNDGVRKLRARVLRLSGRFMLWRLDRMVTW